PECSFKSGEPGQQPLVSRLAGNHVEKPGHWQSAVRAYLRCGIPDCLIPEFMRAYPGQQGDEQRDRRDDRCRRPCQRAKSALLRGCWREEEVCKKARDGRHEKEE